MDFPSSDMSTLCARGVDAAYWKNTLIEILRLKWTILGLSIPCKMLLRHQKVNLNI